jgi:two-component system chemotaxis family response regulator WspR
VGGWSVQFLRAVLEAAPEGIVVCDAGAADQRVTYANAAFLRLSGYELHELLGQDLRQLSRKDGTPFGNELVTQQIRGADGTVTHIASFYRDAAARALATDARPVTGLPSWLREDRLSGLFTREYFEELLHHDWQVGVRDALPLTLMMFDIDELGSYNDTFGRPAGDACIRRVAGIIGASFKRGADVVARWEGGCIVALVRNGDVAAVPEFAATVARRVLGQHIHNPRARRQKFVTVSIGAVSLRPSAEKPMETLLQAAQRALLRAKQGSEVRIAIAEEQDMSAAG